MGLRVDTQGLSLFLSKIGSPQASFLLQHQIFEAVEEIIGPKGSAFLTQEGMVLAIIPSPHILDQELLISSLTSGIYERLPVLFRKNIAPYLLVQQFYEHKEAQEWLAQWNPA